MRTTIAIDDDILAYARSAAQRQRRSVGAALSDLARAGMQSHGGSSISRAGFVTLPKRGVVITTELVNAIRNEEW